MGHPVAQNLSGQGKIIRAQALRKIGAAVHLGQWTQPFKNPLRRDPVVNQAADFINPDPLELFDPVQRILDRAKEATVFKVALKGKIQDRVQLLGGKDLQIQLKGCLNPFGSLEGRKAPGIVLDQPSSRVEIVFHGLARDLSGLCAGVGDKAVQHQSDLVGIRVIPSLYKGFSVYLNFLCHLVNGLPQQMGEHMGAQCTGFCPCFGVACGGDPDRQLARDRAWLCHDRHVFSRAIGIDHRRASPERAQLADGLIHGRLVGRRSVFGAQHKIIRLPPRSQCEPCPALCEIVNHRPILGNPQRMVQRRNNRTGPNGNGFGDRRHGGTGDRRVGIGAAKGVEMPLRCPDCAKAVGVGKFGPLQQKMVFLFARTIIVAPVKQAKVHTPPCHRQPPLRHQVLAGIPCQNNPRATRQRVKQLQNRNIKRQRRHRQPGAIRRQRHARIHAGKEITDILMGHHHPFGPPRGAGCVDHIGQILRACALFGIAGRGAGKPAVLIQQQHMRSTLGQLAQHGLFGDNNRSRAVTEI